jgi:ribosomal protein S18 acetylase RimI-like enzyme
MTDILTDLSQAALAFATQANLCAFFRGLGKSPAADFQEADGLTRWHTAIAHPWFNGVLSTRPPNGSETPTIQETLRYFQSKRVAGITWWLHPSLSLSDWEPHLHPYDFQADKYTPGMAVVLAQLKPSAPMPENLQIHRVEDFETLRVWADVFVAGYGLPPQWSGNFFELLMGLGLDLPLRHYLGYWEDQPVATSTLFLKAGVAGIYNVATLPAARGHGIGSMLTCLPLQEAERMGYRAGVLQSSDMGYSVYSQLGFAKVCDMEHFFWRDSNGQG